MLLADAAEHEKRYEWKEAADCYDELLEGNSLGSPESVDIAFSLAECRVNASYHTGDAESFRAEIENARSTYLRFMRAFDDDRSSLSYRIAEARQIQAESVLVLEGQKRRRLLDEAIRIHRTVLTDSEHQEGKVSLWLGNFHLAMLLERRSIDDGKDVSA